MHKTPPHCYASVTPRHSHRTTQPYAAHHTMQPSTSIAPRQTSVASRHTPVNSRVACLCSQRATTGTSLPPTTFHCLLARCFCLVARCAAKPFVNESDRKREDAHLRADRELENQRVGAKHVLDGLHRLRFRCKSHVSVGGWKCPPKAERDDLSLHMGHGRVALTGSHNPIYLPPCVKGVPLGLLNEEVFSRLSGRAWKSQSRSRRRRDPSC